MMNKSAFFVRLFSILLMLGLLVGYATPVLADAGTRIVTEITFFQPGDANLGEVFILSGTIKDNYDHPVPGRSVIFTIDGVYQGQSRSDENGMFERTINNKLAAGTYIIKATYKGSSEYTTDSAFTEIKILPAEVKIQTVPAIPGITFKLDGREFVSGLDGSASIKVNRAGSYRLDVLIDKYHNPSQRVEFGRWLEESYETFRDIRVPANKVIQVGFNVYHQISQEFLDLDGNSVDQQRIDEFMIRSAQGDAFVFPDGLPRWIPSSRIAHRITGLEETKLLYSVISVTVDGSNVVNQSQQRFYTHSNETWPISLLLYSLHVSAQDGLFGSAVGKSVNVEFPDGQIVNYPLNQAGVVDIHSLARGMYYIELVGSNGLSNRLPVALSRNQVVQAKVVTYLDIAVIVMLGVLAALGLLVYGRPWILRVALRLNHRILWEKTGAQIFKLSIHRARIFRGGVISNKIAGLLTENEDAPIEAIVIDIPESQMELAEVGSFDNTLP